MEEKDAKRERERIWKTRIKAEDEKREWRKRKVREQEGGIRKAKKEFERQEGDKENLLKIDRGDKIQKVEGEIRGKGQKREEG